MILKILKIIILVIIFVAGGFVGYVISSSKIQDQTIKEIFSDTSLPVNTISGKIISISSDKKSLSIEINNPFPGINFPQAYKIKTILITSDTKFFSNEQKDPATLRKEMENFQKSIKIGTSTQTAPPLPFNENSLSANDLKIGNQIVITFIPFQNQGIFSNQFTANIISVINISLPISPMIQQTSTSSVIIKPTTTTSR